MGVSLTLAEKPSPSHTSLSLRPALGQGSALLIRAHPLEGEGVKT